MEKIKRPSQKTRQSNGILQNNNNTKMNYLCSTCFLSCDLKMPLILHVLSPQVAPKSRQPDGKTLRGVTQPLYSQKAPCLKMQGDADGYAVKP